ncbi:transforming growth factor-beta receptor-associated protein 1 [Tachysurus vachellii]|uniref:transforming growth factor-beta receptor-associated protein 1 n=1 Tax=Tachysurus vachellii TaxID=175792 RepID=UPI00296AC104|nr:transforming growth factor-beta receptor-associated protein 1 [Tachysurus vachellii]
MDIFSSSLVFEKVAVAKDKDKSVIQCMECSCNNVYIGSKDGVIQHFTTSSKKGDRQTLRVVTKRQMGRSGEISQLKAVPVLNHLLVLWDSSITALNMFSLEPVAALKKIQNVSLFRLGEPVVRTQQVFVELFVASTKRRAVSIHKVCVDRWECVGNVALAQDPVALAVHETCLCVATSDRYILHDYQTQSELELFTHNLGKQNVLAKQSVKGEFLLNGPGNLGMFVLKSGISQRPPVPWPDEVLDAVVHFPYVLVLQRKSLHVYSMLDQQLKQTVFLNSSKSLHSTTDGVFVVGDREIRRLSQSPPEAQIQKLLGCERVNEALALLDGVQSLLPEDTYKDLHTSIICTSGWIHFYREAFLDAKELFIKGNLDPRELIKLYPGMTLISEDFKSQPPTVSNAKDLRKLNNEAQPEFHKYLSFLSLYLREIRNTDLGQLFTQDIDTTLFKVYLELGSHDNLDQLVSSRNDCSLDVCVPDLERHKRFFTIGLLYQSHGEHFNAIQTWVWMVDDVSVDSSEPNVLLYIVKTLSQLKEKSIIMKFIDWVLQKDQKVGVLIFTERDPGDQSTFEPQEVLSILTNYQLALVLYLEFLVNVQQSQMEKHHTLLANTYTTRILHPDQQMKSDAANMEEMRQTLQQFLWQSSFYDADAVYEKIQSSDLHVEKAILLGRVGEHRKALRLLVDEERDEKAAENYCSRTSAGQGREFTQQLFSCLLQTYLESRPHVPAVVDLLNRNAVAFNLLKVLEVLPGSWSLQLVIRFLLETLRVTTHDRRMRGLEKSLTRMDNLRQRHAWMEATQVMVRVDRSRVCHSCQRQFSGPEFLRRTTGELVHTHCYNTNKIQ